MVRHIKTFNLVFAKAEPVMPRMTTFTFQFLTFTGETAVANRKQD